MQCLQFRLLRGARLTARQLGVQQRGRVVRVIIGRLRSHQLRHATLVYPCSVEQRPHSTTPGSGLVAVAVAAMCGQATSLTTVLLRHPHLLALALVLV